MAKYRKKPVVIEALQWRGNNYSEIIKFAEGNTLHSGYSSTGNLNIRTLEGTMTANKDDWIIKGVEGEFYPCKPLIFEKTYEKVESEDQSES